MEIDSALIQESYECFGVPPAVCAETEGPAATTPPGWNRRGWFLHEGALLGVEALPSAPVSATVEIDRVR